MAGPSGVGGRDDGKVFLYFAPLTLLIYLAAPQGPLLDFATSFMLKNQLHATAPQVSLFRLATAIPIYLSVVFGLSRDLWNPLGRRDRGFFMVFAPVTAGVFLWMAFAPLSYFSLFAGMALVMLAFRFIAAAHQGLLALIGQEQLMTGRLSALWNILLMVPSVLGAVGAGWAAQVLSPSQIFVMMAALALSIFAMGALKPRAVFGNAYDRPLAQGSDLIGDIRRLLRHKAIYPAIAIMFLGQFMPGFNTALQFYLTNTLHAPDATYGLFQAIFFASFIPVYFLYGWLCQRFSLKTLLWVGWSLCVPQMVPLLFVHSANEALLMAVPTGALGGIAVASLSDLTMRSCPPGLQGALMMLVEGANLLSTRGSDFVGAQIFAADPSRGFEHCMLSTVVVYAMILPVLLFIPREVMSSADGEANPALEAEMLAEAAAA